MTKCGTLVGRDIALLRLLDRTPLTTQLILKASSTFPDEPFRDERRVRERLQSLTSMQLAKAFAAPRGVGGSANWYKVTAEGFRYLHGTEVEPPPRARFDAISPSRFHHTRILAEIIVHAIVAAHVGRITVTQFFGDHELTIDGAGESQQPDCFFQFTQSGRQFNLMFEVDCATEPLISVAAENSLRKKLLVYETHQDAVLGWWKQKGRDQQRPYFRVVILTTSAERTSHILWLARESARNMDRHLCYAATHEAFLGSADPLSAPLFNDHHGRWQSLVDLHPSSQFTRTPIRLVPPVTVLGRH